MRTLWRLLLVAVAVLITGTALAQDQRQGWLGVNAEDVTKEEAEKLGWEAPRGAKVIGLTGGSPAAAAGLQAGDVIATLDGVEVENSNSLTDAVMAKGAGAAAKLRVMRAGKEKTITVTLGARPGSLAVDIEKAPQLMLDTGGHTARVIGLAITPDGKHLVSASNDKTVRVWDIEIGKTVRTIRGEAAPGNWGVIHSMALSPDGRWLAVGGYLHGNDRVSASGVRLYEFASGKMAAFLKGHDNVVYAVAFSPDSKRLISGSGDKTAIVWDVTTLRQVHRLSGHAQAVKAVAFTRDGERAVTGSEDQTLRLWNAADGKLVAEMTEHKQAAEREAEKIHAQRKATDKKPEVWHAGIVSVAVSPDLTQLIASGSADGRILLWDGITGAFLRQLAFPGGMRGAADIFSMTFSPDGRWVLSTSTEGGCLINEVATGRALYDGNLHDKQRSYLDDGHVRCNGGTAFSPDERLAAAGYNSAIHLVDARTRKVTKTLESSGAAVMTVVFSEDGRSLLWGNKTDTAKRQDKLTRRLRLPIDGKPLATIEQVDGSTPSLSKYMKEPPDPKYVRRNHEHGALSVDFKSAGPMLINSRYLEISKDGKGKVQTEIDLGDSASGATSFSPITFTPDGQTVIIGLTPEIRAFDLKGAPVGDFIGHYGQVRDLAPSPDGRFLISGATDQTVRLWNLKTRELIVSMFHGNDGEWVIWTPQGYYTGSPGADKIVGWQINKGSDQTADYVGAEQLRQHLHRPDIVERAIVIGSAEEAVREAPGTSFKLADLLARPVPRFKITSPDAGSAQRGGRAVVKIFIDATPDPIRTIRAQVNGRQVQDLTPPVGSGGFGAGEHLLDVPLAQSRNEVRITLTNAIGEKTETLVLNHAEEGDLDKRGTLHIVAIGVNEYKGLAQACGSAGCDLKYSVADARRLADVIEKRLSPGHSRVVKRVLVNGGSAKDAPTASNIIDAVELLRQSEEADTVVLFIAGHGKNDGPDYRFLPTNAEWKSGAIRGSTVVPWQVLQSSIEAAKGRRLLFVDTCHSGNAYNQRLGNAAYHANVIAYTAARFDQEALEDASLGHGLFTYAVVEGLEGSVGSGGDRQVSTKALADYVVQRVGELAKRMNGEQDPQYFRGRDAQDYVLATW
jgi:WD40 repeat protein